MKPNFRLTPLLKVTRLDYYDALTSDITAVYGKGELTDNFRNSENNSMRILRIKSREEVCKTLWVSENNNALALEFQVTNNTLFIKLTYQDQALQSTTLGKRIADF